MRFPFLSVPVMPSRFPCVAVGRACRAKRKWIALTESAVTPPRGLTLLKRIETAIRSALFAAILRTPRAVGAICGTVLVVSLLLHQADVRDINRQQQATCEATNVARAATHAAIVVLFAAIAPAERTPED